jgi:pyruvate formate-lyase/glycerol dehydratase family glycyl radical enzyme
VKRRLRKMATIPKPGSISFEDRVAKSVPFEWGYGSTPRTKRLRDALYWKAAVQGEIINIAMGMGKCEFRQGIRIDMDRARIVTAAFRETEGLSTVLQYTRMVEKLCDEMPIFIKEGELIVGDANSAPDEVRWYPETNVEWVPEAVTTGGFSEMVTEDERREIVEDICPYWEDRSVAAIVKAGLPEDMAPTILLYGAFGTRMWEEARAGPAYDWAMLMRQGLKARVELAEANLRKLDQAVTEMDPGEYLEKKRNWEGMARCGRAILRHAGRYAELARQQAKVAKDETRRKELEKMAEGLEWVPANPPRSFQEALQFYWLVKTIAHYMARWGNGSGTRLDQVFWPYYESDMRSDQITREQAVELVECLFMKIQELGAALEFPLGFAAGSGAETAYTAAICGTTPDGKDASNDLSCIIMEVLANLRLSQPPIGLRYHKSISPDVIQRAIDLDRTGLGHPSYFNEELLEKWGLMRGWSPEDAKNTTAVGCVTNNIMGKAVLSTGVAQLGAANLVKILEEVLQGNDQEVRCGSIVLPAEKNVGDMESSDELMEAVFDRLLFYARIGAVSWNIGQQVVMERRPDPCNSLLLEETLQKGIDTHKFNKLGDTWPHVIPFGAINASDSLAAIQKLVFDDQKYTMEELLKALQANWAGYEEMRQDFLNAPKFGADDHFGDDWAIRFQAKMNETLAQVVDAWGNPCTMDGSTASAYAMFGMMAGASPDGRFASAPLADGTRSPMAGTDKDGPTAVLNSAAKFPYTHTELFNQRFLPVFMEGDNRELFADYLRAWFDTGTIPHVQFNVVGSDEMREAQDHPDEHSDLIVRVAGFSAHFVDLSRPTQDSIIARTEQSFG